VRSFVSTAMPFKSVLRLAVTSKTLALLAGLALAAGSSVACDVQVREGGDVEFGIFSAQATQEWSRTYPLPAGGQIEVANLNGPIDVIQGLAGGSVEVRADIMAKALTDDGAKEILSKGKIEEAVSSGRVKIETVVPRRVHGSYQVRYKVTVPPGVVTHLSATNGPVKSTGFTGTLKVSVVNGRIDLSGIGGALDAAGVNGSVSVKLASVSAPVRLEATNGRLTFELPKASKANLSARVVNGGLNVIGLEVAEQRRNRIISLETTLNGGGPPIELRTTNGRMSITGTP
jgi:putative adhesin